MASRLLTPRRGMKCSSRRWFCSSITELHSALAPAIVTLESSFAPDDSREIRRGSGVFIYSGMIATSAHVVGRLSAVYESCKTAQKRDDGLEHGRILHKSYIGITNAFTDGDKRLKTMPLAVSFANDVAVLGVVENPGETLFTHCRLAEPSPPPKENTMIVTVTAIAQLRLQHRFMTTLNNYRAASEKKERGRAPWPLDDGLGWIKRDFYMPDGGEQSSPTQGKISFNEKVDGSFSKFSGSPWFNLQGDVVGIASWELRDENYPDLFVAFGVPPLSVKSVMEYALTKGPQDPIVMDPWVDASEIH